MKSKAKTVLLLSGGLDSTAILYSMRANNAAVHCVSFDYGQAHVQELICARWHAERMGCQWTKIVLPPLGGLTDASKWIVPNRNAILIGIAVNFAHKIGASSVVIGCNADDAAAFPDCRPEFITHMNTATQSAGFDIEISAPFLTRSKAFIGGLAQELGIPLDSIWTCYRGGIEPCGECPACQKLNALK